jgi:mannose-6-phosphate isomerase-like protein (cupin superfamily)
LVTKHEHIVIHKGDWHKLENFGKEDLHIVEIQFGDKCEEQDIERKDNE